MGDNEAYAAYNLMKKKTEWIGPLVCGEDNGGHAPWRLLQYSTIEYVKRKVECARWAITFERHVLLGVCAVGMGEMQKGVH